MHARFATAVSLMLATGFCTPPPPPPGCDASVTLDSGACWVLGRNESQCADLIVGSGRDGTLQDFHAFQPGDSVYVTPGSQGLQHIVVALRGSGFERTSPLIGLRFVRADDCVSVGYLRVRFPFQIDPADPQLLALEAVRVVLLNDADPLQYCTILGNDVILLADLDDGAGHRAHREMRLHVAGIDPTVPPAMQQAWVDACTSRDAGTRDP